MKIKWIGALLLLGMASGVAHAEVLSVPPSQLGHQPSGETIQQKALSSQVKVLPMNSPVLAVTCAAFPPRCTCPVNSLQMRYIENSKEYQVCAPACTPGSFMRKVVSKQGTRFQCCTTTATGVTGCR